MQYTLIANSVTPDQVEERVINGDRHLVAEDVTFIRPMRLAGGYVPREHVANSAPDWDRSPLTINHPKNLPDRPWYDSSHGGYYVSANKTPEVRERKVIGHALNPSKNPDSSVAADLAVNVEKVNAIANGLAVSDEDATAAEQLLEALKNGEAFNVSSQYFPNPLPAGKYDGAHREQAEAIANADSIALLPTKDGVCSLEDGCGFKAEQATANADSDTIRAPVANADADDIEIGDRVTWPSQGTRPAAGVVREIIEEGRFDTEIGGEAVVTAPAALIRVFKPAGDTWKRSDTMVAHKLPTVTAVGEWPDAETDDPTGARSSGSDTTTEGRTLFANKTVDGISYDGVAEGTLDESAIPNDDYAAHFVFADEENKSDSGFPLVDADGNLRRGNVAAAFRFREDAPDTDRLLSILAEVNDEFDEPPIDPDSLDEALTGNSGGLVDDVLSFIGLGSGASPETTGAESPADAGTPPAANGSDPADEPGATMDNRDELIDEITSNSAITAESLDDACDERVELIHDDVMDGTDPTGNGGSNDGGTDAIVERLDSMEEKMVTEDQLDDVVANAKEQTEREERVERIIANSAEYEEDDKETLLDTPDAVLEDIESGLSSNGTLPGSAGAAERATANAGGSSDDLDDYNDGTIGGGA